LKAALAATTALGILLLTACGDDSSPVTVTFTPAIPEDTPELSKAAILDATVGNIRQRAQLYGIEIPEIVVGDDNTITVTAEGIDETTALELFGRRASVEFKRPLLTTDGIVTCKTASGEEFGVLPANVNPDDASASPARCFARDKIGDPVWTAAVASGGEQLTSDAVRDDGWTARDDQLVVSFTEAGSTTLESLTNELVGYPLGLFLDGHLIAAPRISGAITNGEAVISGFGEADARMRAAQLNAGPLAAELTKLSPASSAP
jgi:preprotein translocase subunit SecD